MKSRCSPKLLSWILCLALICLVSASMLGQIAPMSVIAADAGCTEMIAPEVTIIDG